MKKTLFLTAILVAVMATQTQAGWNEDNTIYTFTGEGDAAWADVVGTNTLTKIIVNEDVIVSGDTLTMTGQLNTVEVNGTLTLSNKVRFQSANTTLSGSGTVNVKNVEYFSQNDNQFTQSVANFNVSGTAKVDAFYADPIFSGNTVTLTNGLGVANWHGASTVKVVDATLKLGNTIRKEGGSLNPDVSFSGTNVIDIAGLSSRVSQTNLELPEGNTNGFAKSNLEYQIFNNIGNVAYGDGAVVTFKKGDTVLGTQSNLDTTTGYFNSVTEKVDTGLYVIQDGSTMTAAQIKAIATESSHTLSGAYVAADSAIELTTNDLALNTVWGSGKATISVNQTLEDVGTVNTGALLIKDSTLTLRATTWAETLGSIASFESVELDNATLYYNNGAQTTKADTFQNVKIAAGKSGTIHMYDCGGGNNGQVVTMSGTTAIDGTLTLLNDWQGRLTISDLQGSGNVNICGTSASSTTSNEMMYYTIGIQGSAYTGTLTSNNSNAQIILDIAESGSLNANQIVKNQANSLTLKGSGQLKTTGTTMLSGATLTSGAEGWTGTVTLTAGVTEGGNKDKGFNISSLATDNSVIEFNGVTGWDGDNWDKTMSYNVKLTDTEESAAWTLGAYSSQSQPTAVFSGTWTGDGTLKLNTISGSTMNYTYSGNISGWEGEFISSVGSTLLTMSGNANTVNAAITKGTGTLNLKVATNSVAAFSKAVSVNDLELAQSSAFNQSLTVKGAISQSNGKHSLRIFNAADIGGKVTMTNMSTFTNEKVTLRGGADIETVMYVGGANADMLFSGTEAYNLNELKTSYLQANGTESGTNAQNRKITVGGGTTVNVNQNISIGWGLTSLILEDEAHLNAGGIAYGDTAHGNKVGAVELGSGSVLQLGGESHNGTLTTAALTVGGNATLNSNLVIVENGALTSHGVLSMGCAVTLGSGTNITVDGDVTAGPVYLFTGVDSLTLGNASINNATWTDAAGYVINGVTAGAGEYVIGYWDGAVSIAASNVPEPATATLSLLALAALAARRRRR